MIPWELGGAVKIDRAREHVQSLETEMTEFIKRGPNEPVQVPDPSGDVVVGEVDGLKGKVLLPTLIQFVGVVESIVGVFRDGGLVH